MQHYVLIKQLEQTNITYIFILLLKYALYIFIT